MSAYTPEVPNRTRTRLQISLLAALFFLPFIGGYAAFYLFPDAMPKGRVNYGTLINPVRPMPVGDFVGADGQALAGDWLREKWTLLYIAKASVCDDACLREVVLARQTRQAMNRDDSRVRRVLLAAADVDLAALKAQLGKEHPDLVFVKDRSNTVLPVFADAPDHALMIVDPLGNWLMQYPPASSAEQIQKDFKGLQKDLRKLLKLSHIG